MSAKATIGITAQQRFVTQPYKQGGGGADDRARGLCVKTAAKNSCARIGDLFRRRQHAPGRIKDRAQTAMARGRIAHGGR
jgi:hypothetical protein